MNNKTCCGHVHAGGARKLILPTTRQSQEDLKEGENHIQMSGASEILSKPHLCHQQHNKIEHTVSLHRIDHHR